MQTILSETALLQQYNSFPQELQLAVSSYIELLTVNYEKYIQKNKKKHSKRELGGLEGKINVPDDFNEPLECFKDYMS